MSDTHMDKAAREKAREKIAEREQAIAADWDIAKGVCEADLAGMMPQALDDLDAADSDNARLQARVSELEAALKPFLPPNQQITSILFGQFSDDEPANVTVRLGDLRRASRTASRR